MAFAKSKRFWPELLHARVKDSRMPGPLARVGGGVLVRREEPGERAVGSGDHRPTLYT